ncbi:hypothetical protein QOT17_014446 [Balamuthia mandrillaris]
MSRFFAVLTLLSLVVALSSAHQHCELSLFNAFTSSAHDSLAFTIDGKEWAEVPFGERVVESVPCSPFTVNVTELGKGEKLDFFSEGYMSRGWLVFKGYESTEQHVQYTGWRSLRLPANLVPPAYGAMVHGGDTPYAGNYLLVTNSSNTVQVDDSSEQTYRAGLEYSEEGSEFVFALYTAGSRGDESGNSDMVLEETVQAPGEQKLAFVYVYGYTGEAVGGTGVEPALEVFVEELDWDAASGSAASRVTSPVVAFF